MLNQTEINLKLLTISTLASSQRFDLDFDFVIANDERRQRQRLNERQTYRKANRERLSWQTVEGKSKYTHQQASQAIEGRALHTWGASVVFV